MYNLLARLDDWAEWRYPLHKIVPVPQIVGMTGDTIVTSYMSKAFVSDAKERHPPINIVVP